MSSNLANKEHQQQQQHAPAFSPMRPSKLDLNAGSDYGEALEEEKSGGGRRRRSRNHSDDGQGRRVGGLQRGVSAAMLKEGTDLPNPGLFDGGPPTPDLQQQVK